MTESVADYSFARRPKWVISHLLVGLLIVAMIAAMFWQVGRHGERADRNDLISARAELAPVELSSVASPSIGVGVGEVLQYTPVTVRGRYRTADEVLIRNRSLNGDPGWWVLTPLVNDEGWGVAVNRGWLPISYDAGQARAGTEPPEGVVEVTGWIQPSRTAEGFQQADPDAGRLTSLGRADVERLEQQLDYPLAPVVVLLDPESTSEGLPIALSLPELDSGPHLAYAGQWLIFTLIAVVGYPLVLRRVARGGSGLVPEEDL